MTSLTRKISTHTRSRRPIVLLSVACSLCLTALLFVFEAAPAAGQAKAHAATRAAVVNVTIGKPTELGFTLSKASVPQGTVTFKVTNKGLVTHDFKICTSPMTSSSYPNSCDGKVTKRLEHGQSATLTVTFKKGGLYEYLCTVPGHANAGMKGSLGVSTKTAPPAVVAPKVATPSVTKLTGEACAAGTETSIAVEETDFGFTLANPDDLDNPGGPTPADTPRITQVPCGAITFIMRNTGTVVHNFDISYLVGDKAVGIGDFIAPGHTATMTVTLAPGKWAFLCDVPQHAALGMVGELLVTQQ